VGWQEQPENKLTNEALRESEKLRDKGGEEDATNSRKKSVRTNNSISTEHKM